MKNRKNNLTGSLQSIRRSFADFPELVHCWRFLTGVVYALNQYYLLSKCRSSSPQLSDEQDYVEQTIDVLDSISTSQIPPESWLKGFYYNAALMRLDAAYERFFKAYLGIQEIDGPNMYKKIRHKFRALFPEQDFKKSNFGKIRQEVNSLKHYVGGEEPNKREQAETLEQALIALVAFLNEPTVINEMKKFSGKGIIVGRKASHNRSSQQKKRGVGE